VIAVVIVLVLAVIVYQRMTDPLPRQERIAQRQLEESVVVRAREILRLHAGLGRDLEIVDPLEKNRAIGKVYIYPVSGGWQVSGYYQRAGEQRWHPWLMTLDRQQQLVELSVQDAVLGEAPGLDARVIIKP